MSTNTHTHTDFTRIYIKIYICTSEKKKAHIQQYINTNICTYEHVYISSIYTYTYTCTYMYMYIYTHTYIYRERESARARSMREGEKKEAYAQSL